MEERYIITYHHEIAPDVVLKEDIFSTDDIYQSEIYICNGKNEKYLDTVVYSILYNSYIIDDKNIIFYFYNYAYDKINVYKIYNYKKNKFVKAKEEKRLAIFKEALLYNENQKEEAYQNAINESDEETNELVRSLKQYFNE